MYAVGNVYSLKTNWVEQILLYPPGPQFPCLDHHLIEEEKLGPRSQKSYLGTNHSLGVNNFYDL
jgi:hypothetical protein